MSNADVSTEDVKQIKNLIAGRPHGDRKFLFDIVSNSRNGIDVDKFDYLNRDCHNIGIQSSYDASRLMKYSRVINGRAI